MDGFGERLFVAQSHTSMKLAVATIDIWWCSVDRGVKLWRKIWNFMNFYNFRIYDWYYVISPLFIWNREQVECSLLFRYAFIYLESLNPVGFLGAIDSWKSSVTIGIWATRTNTNEKKEGILFLLSRYLYIRVGRSALGWENSWLSIYWLPFRMQLVNEWETIQYLL